VDRVCRAIVARRGTVVKVETARTGAVAAARRGVVWQGAAYVLARLLLLVSTAVLARVLGPADFGFIAFGLVIVTTLNVVSDVGVSQALVYLPASQRVVDTALAVGVTASVLLGLAWVAVVPWVVGLLGRPESALMLQVLAVVLVVTTLGQVPDAVLRKSLQFSRRMPGELTRGLARGLVAIGLALAGFGAWSLVWAEIAGAVGFAVVSWLMVRHRIGSWRRWFDRGEVRSLLRFGVPTALNGGLNTVVLNIDYLVVVAVLGQAALGGYFVGFRIPELVVVSAFYVFSQVTYPMFASVRGEPERLRRGYLLATRVQSTYGVAASVGIAVAAPVLVPVLFGPEYAGSVAVMQLIAISAVFRSVTAGTADVFKAVGRPEVGMWLGVVRIVLLVPALFLGTRWGITGVGAAQAVMAVLFAVLAQQIVCRVIDLRVRDLLRQLVPPLLVGIGTGAGAALGLLLTGAPDWPSLVVTVLASVLVGVAVLALVDRGTIRKVVAS
jgi:PST family polysaccharide transporter